MTYNNAHAAKIDENGIVREVIVIPHLDDDDAKITAYCNRIGLAGTWVDTSYTGSRRGKYAGVGDLFHEEARSGEGEFVSPGAEPEPEPEPTPEPEPEAPAGELFSRTYTLQSDVTTEPGLIYPSTGYIKLNREDALLWQENVEEGVDVLCEHLPEGGSPAYRRRYFNIYYDIPQSGASKLRLRDGYDGDCPVYLDKLYTLTAYPAGQIPDDETLDAASAKAAD